MAGAGGGEPGKMYVPSLSPPRVKKESAVKSKGKKYNRREETAPGKGFRACVTHWTRGRKEDE